MSKHKYSEIRVPIEKDNVSIWRDESKCIMCGRCKAVCTDVMAVCGKYSLLKTDDTAVCINCGQCVKACPVGSLQIAEEWEIVRKQIADPDSIVIVSTSPSCRVSLGDEFGLPAGSFVQGKMVALLRKLGFKYVLDTNFGADLTIMEEASELLHRIKSGGVLPQFTSCCPAWVKYVETFHPDMISNLSSCKSPIGMMGPTIKTYFAKNVGIDPDKIINVALTPCTAKKAEIRRDEMNAAGKYYDNVQMRDMDYVITTRELVKWAKAEGIDFASLDEAEYDNLMGTASGAGVIFGNTGGVMEAALRTAYKMATGKTPTGKLLHFEDVRSLNDVREAQVDIAGTIVKVAVVYGTASADKLLEQIRKGDKQYHFVEVMACPGGCVGGGGQPKESEGVLNARMQSLYQADEQLKLRCSMDNPDIVNIYDKHFGEPLSAVAEEMLHTHYTDRSEILNHNKNVENEEQQEQPVKSKAGKATYVCSICGYEHVGDSAPSECPICGVDSSRFTIKKQLA